MTRTTKTPPQDATRAAAGCAVALLCAIALACFPAANAHARLGDLDPGFASGGIALPAIGTPGALDAVLMLPDGKLLAAGTANMQSEMLALRLTPTGALDPTFNPAGPVPGVVRLPNPPFAELSALAFAPGGDVIGVGSAGRSASTAQPSAVRISHVGAVTEIPLVLPTDVIARNLAGVTVLADGRIVVGGTATIIGRAVFLAGRLAGTGTPDPSFGGDGWAFADFGSSTRAEAAALAIAPTGAVTLAGQVATAVGAPPSQAAAARFTPTGLPDPNFGTNGQLTMSFEGISQFLDVAQADAGVLAAGSFAGLSQAVLERVTDAGAPDGGFGTAGMTTWQGTPLARGEAVALDSLGGAVVAGRAGIGNVWSLQTGWFTATGAPAPAGGGIRLQPVGLANAAPPLGLAMGPGDASVVAGTTSAGAPVVARFAPNAPPSAALAGAAQLAGAPQAVVGAPVTFDAGASADPEGEPLRFAFDLDGNGSYEFDGGANPIVLRSFPAPGRYTVGVRVSDPRGASATAAHAIDVSTATRPVPRPLLGKQGVAKPLKGIVRFRLPGTKKFVRLDELTAIPNGTEVDARKGRVLLTVLHDASGRLDGAQFYSGRFTFRQGKGKAPITTLTLTGGSFKGCILKPHPARSSALAIASSLDKGRRSKRKVRKLWGDGRGRFRTRGKYGAATVRGTKWLTQDRCDGTLVRVVRGKVSVEDLVRRRRKNRLIKAGGQIFLPAVQRLKPEVQR